MMFFWSKYPFLRYTVLLITGIILHSMYSELPVLVGMAGLFLLLIFLYVAKAKLLISFNWLYGLVISLLFLTLGYYNAQRFQKDENPLQDDIVYFKAVISSSPESRNAFQRMVVSVNASRSVNWRSEDHKLLLYVRDTSLTFNYGDELLI